MTVKCFFLLFLPVRESEMPGQLGSEKARSEADGRSGSLQPAHFLQPSPLGGQEEAIAVGQVHSGLHFTSGRPRESHSGGPGPFRPSLTCLIDSSFPTFLLSTTFTFSTTFYSQMKGAVVAVLIPCNLFYSRMKERAFVGCPGPSNLPLSTTFSTGMKGEL